MLKKIMIFLRGPTHVHREAFQESMLTVCSVGESPASDAKGLVINIVGMPPAELPYRPPSDASVGSIPDYDVILEVWTNQSPVLMVNQLLGSLPIQPSLSDAYQVSVTKVFDRYPFHRGRPSQGTKLISRLMFHADMPDSAARRSWGLHARLAAEVHVGGAIYSQNWVEHTLLEHSAPTRGIAVMHFPSDHDFLHRFVDSPRGMAEILQDTSHFVAGGPRCYCTEHLIREV